MQLEPYLHIEAEHIYNPLTDRYLRRDEVGESELRRVATRNLTVSDMLPVTRQMLLEQGWLIADSSASASRFRLKYVSLEAHTICNQACYFCPVSLAPRREHFMPTPLYGQIVAQLSAYRHTIEAVFMINYNEPTADKRFIEQVQLLKAHELPPAVLTNGSGLTPARVDALLALGGLRFLSVNLSTLDRARYAKERGVDQLPLVLRNLAYAQDKALAPQMDLIVLGTGDDRHQQDFQSIQERFAGSRFTVKSFEVMDRAGYLSVGQRPVLPYQNLCGCENIGSRPLQHLHITPHGQCVLCCEDYDEHYVVGDLTQQTVTDVLTGPLMEQMRRRIYGLEAAPDDFICRRCVFARTR